MSAASGRFRLWQEAKLNAEAEGLIQAAADVIGQRGQKLAGDVFAGVETVDAAIANAWTPWNGALFKRAARLQVLARTGIGYDNVNVPEATECGVCILNTPDAPTESTAEFTLALMFSVARKLGLAERRFRAEGWVPATELLGFDLAEKTLGLAGLGRIGSRVAEVARALRMRVIAYDPFIKPEMAAAKGVELVPSLDALLAASDVVSLHLPMSAQNRGIIGERELGRMKKGSILINAARGPLVVEKALYDAVKSGHLAGAGIDVWDPEPTGKDNPLLTLDTVVAAPHIAAATVEGWRRSHVTAAETVLMVLRGQRPPNLVNPEVWEKRQGRG